MDGKDTSVPKKRRGPEPTGQGAQIQVRLQPGYLNALDAWRGAEQRHTGGDLKTRPEAIRMILKDALFL